MKKSMHQITNVIALALVIASGCREAGTIVQTGGESVPASITPRAEVATSGTIALVTLVLDVRGEVGKIGSFTGRLRFNPAALQYEAEVDLLDGTLRASNPGAGVIRVAGASTSGMNVAKLAAFRFTVKNGAVPQDISFEVEEVHELSRLNLQASLVRSPATEERP